MHIAVVVVSFNTKELLRNCLQSVTKSFECDADSDDQLSIVVVDSASSDGSAEMVASEFSDVYLLAQTTNIGFVAGNNLALQALGFPVNQVGLPNIDPILSPEIQLPTAVLLLNPDAQLKDDALWQMARFLNGCETAGGCGAYLEYGDGSFQHGGFRFPTLAQIIIDFFPLTGLPGAQRIHNSSLNGRYRQALWQGQEPFEVDFVLGAALMVDGCVIKAIGGLDSDYVMYCEEMDWCLRIANAGWIVYAVPAAKVIHHEAQSSKQRRWETYVQLWRSRFLFYQKHSRIYPAGYSSAVRLLLKWGLWWRKRQAERSFANGHTTGIELAGELSAYNAVGEL